jgi:hypothetical protein
MPLFSHFSGGNARPSRQVTGRNHLMSGDAAVTRWDVTSPGREPDQLALPTSPWRSRLVVACELIHLMNHERYLDTGKADSNMVAGGQYGCLPVIGN